MQQHTRHLVIVGRVQGVGFRYSMVRNARDLGLTGWVRNRADGSVEALLCGDERSLDALIEWARRGPAAARVTEVSEAPAEVERAYERFEIWPSA